jgi:sortase, SrtB family
MKKQPKVAKKVVNFIDSMVNFLTLLILLLFLAYGTYSLWDSKQITDSAQSTQYESYKPSDNEELSFDQLKKKNKDVFAWLNVYGTKIDYPVVQGKNNEKYVNTDVLGNYSLSGSIFLDYRNSKNFTDFNSIIFGHHMAKSAMFGDLANFSDKNYFAKHKYGNLFYQGKNHGIEFFAFMKIDAFNSQIYMTPLTSEGAKARYLSEIDSLATNKREMSVTTSDHLVLLSTCTSSSTNGRHVLVGRLTDKEIPIPDEFKEKNKSNDLGDFQFGQDNLFSRLKKSGLMQIILIIVLLLFIYIIYRFTRKDVKVGRRNDNN